MLIKENILAYDVWSQSHQSVPSTLDLCSNKYGQITRPLGNNQKLTRNKDLEASLQISCIINQWSTCTVIFRKQRRGSSRSLKFAVYLSLTETFSRTSSQCRSALCASCVHLCYIMSRRRNEWSTKSIGVWVRLVQTFPSGRGRVKPPSEVAVYSLLQWMGLLNLLLNAYF